jgi:hypothetical protein
VWLAGIQHNLKAGDGVVLVGTAFFEDPASSAAWQFRLLDEVEVDPVHGRTRVAWKTPLGDDVGGGGGAPEVYVLRRRAAAFGHNAPLWRSMNREFREDYGADPAQPDEWKDFTTGPYADESGGAFDLDTVYPEVRVNSLAVLARGDLRARNSAVALYLVTSATDVSRAEFALTGKVTRLGLAGARLTRFHRAVRDTSAYIQSESVTLAPQPVAEPISGDRLPLAVEPGGLHAGHRLIIVGEDVRDRTKRVHTAQVADIQPHASGSMLTIRPAIPTALTRATVVVYANVAIASHGETCAQILGSGDAGRRHQRFELKRLPLTYRSAATDTGADSELTVRVGDIEWLERATLFGAGPDDRIYTLDVDEQGRSWVVFGDGVHGARLPSGINNVRASYRQGLGRAGNVAADALTQLVTRPLGLKSVTNPFAAAGGTDPEAANQAVRTLPLGARTLGRAVSLLDYEDFARAFAGIAKAQARVLKLPAGPIIALTVAGERGAVLSDSSPMHANLLEALTSSGDPHVSVTLVSYQPRTFRLALRVTRDRAYAIGPVLAAVEASLRDTYSFEKRALGQPVIESEIVAVVHGVPGVVAVDLDGLLIGSPSALRPARRRPHRLLASPTHVVRGIVRPAELLTIDPGPFASLEEMI